MPLTPEQIAEELEREDSAKAASSISLGLKRGNAEQHGKDLTISDKTGLPLETVQRQRDSLGLLDPDKMKAARLAENDLNELYPEAKQFMSDPNNVALASDDPGVWGRIVRNVIQMPGAEAFKDTIQNADSAVKTAKMLPGRFELGMDMNKLIELRTRQMYGTPLSKEEEAMAEAISASVETAPQGPTGGFFSEGALAASQNLPQMGRIIAKGGLGYGLGYGAGFGTSMLVSLIPGLQGAALAAPEVGAITAQTIGGVGAAVESYQQNAALAYDSMLKIKDENGKALDPAVMRGAAALTGAIAAPLDLFGISKIAQTFPGIGKLKQLVAKHGIKKVVQMPGAAALFKEVGKKFAIAVTAETATEFTQQEAQILNEEAAKLIGNLEGGDFKPRTPGQITEELYDTAKTAAGMTFWMAGAGASLNVAVEGRKVGRHTPEQVKAHIDNIHANLADQKSDISTLFQRHEDRAHEFLKTIADNDKLYIDAQAALDVIGQIPQEQRQALFAARPDFQLELARAAATDADVLLTKSDYIRYIGRYVAGTPLADTIAQNVRFDPADYTTAMRDALAQAIQQDPTLARVVQDEARRKLPEAPQESYHAVERIIRKAMTQAQRPSPEVRAVAPFYAKFITRQATATGLDPLEHLGKNFLGFENRGAGGELLSSGSNVAVLLDDFTKLKEGKTVPGIDERGKAAIMEFGARLEASGLTTGDALKMDAQALYDRIFGTGGQSTETPESTLEQPNPAEALPLSGVMGSMLANLSAATMSSDGATGLKTLTEQAMTGDETARATLHQFLDNTVKRLMSGLQSVRIEGDFNTGLYGGNFEPSVGFSVSFDEAERPQVVAALAQAAQAFDQEQLHILGRAEGPLGTQNADGSVNQPYWIIGLNRPLTDQEMQQVVAESGLKGITANEKEVSFYHAGTKETASGFLAGAARATEAIKRIGAASGHVQSGATKLWIYGHGDGAAPYDTIAGEVHTPTPGANPNAALIAERYFGGRVSPTEQAKTLTDEQTLKQRTIAEQYAALADNDMSNPLVRKAYEELAREVVEQFKALPIKVEAWEGKGEPYKKKGRESASDQMRRDVEDKNHMWYYATTPETFGPPGVDFSGHPLLEESGIRDKTGRVMLMNDLLRVVHDYYAHTLTKAQFGPLGEEAAWMNHMATIKNPWARWAITTETRGQNSWVNFNREVIGKDIPTKDRPFARQKAALLPLAWSLTGKPEVDAPIQALMAQLQPDQLNGSLTPDQIAAADASVADKLMQSDGVNLAPNGKPSNLPNHLYKMVRTPAFKAWFGDWEYAAKNGGVWNMPGGFCSKVVDENGEPKVVYHGSQTAGFKKFAPEASKKTEGVSFFTSERGNAKTYSGKNDDALIYTGQELFDNPKLLDGLEVKEYPDEGVWRVDYNGYGSELANKQEVIEYLNNLDTEEHDGIYSAFLNIRHPAEEHFEGANWDGDRSGQDVYQVNDADGELQYTPDDKQYYTKKEAESLVAKNEGWTMDKAPNFWNTTDGVAREGKDYGDGAIIYDVLDDGSYASWHEPVTVYVITKPEQVKSVDNVGTFDPNDPNILFQKDAFTQAQRNNLGLYSKVEKEVLAMNLPGWKGNPKLELSLEQEERLMFLRGTLLNMSDMERESDEYAHLNAEWNELKAQARKAEGTEKGSAIWQKLKSAGVKKEEVEWMGLENFLTPNPNASFTREEVVRYIRANGVNVEEVVADKEEGGTEFDWVEETLTMEEAYGADYMAEKKDEWIDQINADERLLKPLAKQIIKDNFDKLLAQAREHEEHGLWKDKLYNRASEFLKSLSFDDFSGLKHHRPLEAKQIFRQVAQMENLDEATRDKAADFVSEFQEIFNDEEDTMISIVTENDEWKPMLDELVEKLAEEKAQEEYDENQVTRWTDNRTGYEIVGNDDAGYTINGRSPNRSGIYSFAEAEIAARDMAINNGDIEETEDVHVKKWEGKSSPGKFENYREIKLIFPDPENGTFSYDVHFPDDNVLAFVRANDRMLPIWDEIKAEADALPGELADVKDKVVSHNGRRYDVLLESIQEIEEKNKVSMDELKVELPFLKQYFRPVEQEQAELYDSYIDAIMDGDPGPVGLLSDMLHNVVSSEKDVREAIEGGSARAVLFSAHSELIQGAHQFTWHDARTAARRMDDGEEVNRAAALLYNALTGMEAIIDRTRDVEGYKKKISEMSDIWRENKGLDRASMISYDLTLKKVKSLHADEFQSDWHQQGRQHGYNQNLDEFEVLMAVGEMSDKAVAAFTQGMADYVGTDILNPETNHRAEEMKVFFRARDKIIERAKELGTRNPPGNMKSDEGDTTDVRSLGGGRDSALAADLKKTGWGETNKKLWEVIVDYFTDMRPAEVMQAITGGQFAKKLMETEVVSNYKEALDIIEQLGGYEVNKVSDAVARMPHGKDVLEYTKAIGKMYEDLESNSSDIPDVPFKDDGWMELGLKRLLINAAEDKSYGRLSWPDAEVLMKRWSSRYEKLYRMQYDTKMVSIVKKLTKQEPVHIISDSTTGGGGYWYIDMTPELREKILKESFSLFQRERGYTKTATPFNSPDFEGRLKKVIIAFTDRANRSTAPHEFSHFAVATHRYFAQVARQKISSGQGTEEMQRLLDDWELLKKSIGATEDIFTREQEEAVAKAFEDYLMKGKAPSDDLRRIFAQFRTWMVQIYDDIKQSGVDVNPDIEKVFDRWLASETAIEKVSEKNSKLAQIAEALGVEGLVQKVASYVNDAMNAAEEKLYKELEAEEKRRESDAYKKEFDGLRPSVVEEMKAKREYTVMDYLKQNSFKFLTGPETDGLGDQLVSDNIEDTVHPDDVATLFAYDSGQQMLRALRNAPDFDRAVDNQVRSLLSEKYPDMIKGGRIQHKALDAIMNDKVLLALDLMVKELGKKTGQASKVSMKAFAKVIAQQQFETIKMKDIGQSFRYEVAREKALRNALMASREGRPDEALIHLQKAMVNQLLYKMLEDFKETKDKADELFRKVNQRDKSLAGARDVDFVGAARYIMHKFGLAYEGFNINEWIAGIEAQDPDLMQDLIGLSEMVKIDGKPAGELTVPEFLTVYDAVVNIFHIAKEQKEFSDGRKRVQLDNVVAELRDKLDTHGKVKLPAGTRLEGIKEDAKKDVYFFKNMLRKVELWTEAMDGGQNGPFKKYIFMPINRAQDALVSDRRKYLKRLLAIEKRYKHIINKKGKIPTSMFKSDPDLGTVQLTFGSTNELLGFMLHTGNASSLDKLLRGFQIEAPLYEQAMKELGQRGVITDEHWDYCQEVWDLLADLEPVSQRVFKKMFGYRYNKVDVVPFEATVPGGTKVVRGGYYPASINSDLSWNDKAVEKMLDAAKTSTLLGHVGKGFTESRVQAYAQPLMTDLRLASQHIEHVLRFIHLAPAAREVAKILRRKEFAKALKDVEPKSMNGLLVPWMQRFQRQAVEPPVDNDADEASLRRKLNYMRGAAISQILGYNILIPMQDVANIPVAARIIGNGDSAKGLWYVAKGFAHNALRPHSNAAEIRQMSEFMNNRSGIELQAIEQELARIEEDKDTKFKSGVDFVRRHQMLFFHVSEAIIGRAIWRGAFNANYAETNNQQQAVEFADSIYRKTMGSSRVIDTSKFEASHPFVKVVAPLINYALMQLNLQTTEFGNIARKHGWKGSANMFCAYMMMIAAPTFIASLIKGWFMGKLPDDDDHDGKLIDDFLAWLGVTQAQALIGEIPIAGQLVNAGINVATGKEGADRLTLSPAVTSIEKTYKTAKNLYRAAQGDEKVNDGLLLEQTLATLGFITNIPLGRPGKAAGYTVNVMEGKEKPDNVIDFGKGIVAGGQPKKK